MKGKIIGATLVALIGVGFVFGLNNKNSVDDDFIRNEIEYKIEDVEDLNPKESVVISENKTNMEGLYAWLYEDTSRDLIDNKDQKGLKKELREDYFKLFDDCFEAPYISNIQANQDIMFKINEMSPYLVEQRRVKANYIFNHHKDLRINIEQNDKIFRAMNEFVSANYPDNAKYVLINGYSYDIKDLNKAIQDCWQGDKEFLEGTAKPINEKLEQGILDLKIKHSDSYNDYLDLLDFDLF